MGVTPGAHHAGVESARNDEALRRRSGRPVRLQHAASRYGRIRVHGRAGWAATSLRRSAFARAFQKITEAAQELPADDPSLGASEVARGGLGRLPSCGDGYLLLVLPRFAVQPFANDLRRQVLVRRDRGAIVLRGPNVLSAGGQQDDALEGLPRQDRDYSLRGQRASRR